MTATATRLDRILRLPSSIRRRIYLYLGLATWNGLPHTFDLHDRKASTSCDAPPSSFHGLLLSCRAIHAEAAALLYSVNRFLVYYSKPGSLEPLRHLTAPTVACLTSLKVVLNQASCHDNTYDDYGHCCSQTEWLVRSANGQYHCKERHQNLHSLPLLSSVSNNNDDKYAAQVMLDEWHSTAAYLSTHVGSGRLNLSLVCDVDHEYEHGIETAKLAVAPLLLFPPLENYHIRLSKTYDARFQQVAQDAVLQARRATIPYTTPSSTSKTLINLPRELRLRILEYTDLITPYREVMWSRQRRGYDIFHLRCRVGDGLTCEPDTHHGCQFNRCWNSRRVFNSYDPEPTIGCFCRLRHSAFSSTCKCWAPPRSLFLVCRSLRWDAELVFFSANRFIVHDYKWYHPCQVPVPPLGHWRPGIAVAGDYPNERFAVSQFLREIVPIHCLSHLRFLELVFPPYTPRTWPRSSHAALRDWRATVNWVRDKVNAPGLTLRVVMNHLYDDDPEDPANRSVMTDHDGNKILRAYARIFKPLRLLAADGLARFYTQLTDPWENTYATYDYLRSLDASDSSCEASRIWLDARTQRLEDNTKRFVMGNRYESVSSGNTEELAKSTWQEKFAKSYN